MTSWAEEREEQRRWRLLPSHAGLTRFDRLLANEFRPPDEQRTWQQRALIGLIRYAGRRIPYYRNLFQELGLTADAVRGPEDLPKIPLLSKRDVHEHEAALQPKTLPRGEMRFGHTMSSGTTGRPTRVMQSASNNKMFTLLKQREFRWFRFDPAGTLAAIRLASQLPPRRDGKPYPDGKTCRLASWPYVGSFFETGPFVAFNVTNPVEDQIAWLKRRRPQYLMSYSETLEHLAFACEGRSPVDSLRGLLAISEQLTGSMARRIEATFAVPIHQNYGLNEIGLIAVRCQAGRYHVHTEHCLVEIVDEDGRPSAPGETGRIVVTAFRNLAMPLIRYDTDDMAVVVEGPCPCGRMLPSFGEVAGRYSRIVFLPEGTLGYVGAVREALEKMPAQLARGLRQFQVHQFRDDTFELRLLAAEPLPGEFADRIREAWKAAVGEKGAPLRIVEVDHIARSPGGKFQDFTSDFVPAPDRDETPGETPGEVAADD